MKQPLGIRLLLEALMGLAVAALVLYSYVASDIPVRFVYQGF